MKNKSNFVDRATDQVFHSGGKWFEDSQNRQTVKYIHESRGSRNQELLY
jgi:hypothetical protein